MRKKVVGRPGFEPGTLTTLSRIRRVRAMSKPS
jgi:hypothetical protein